jgi:hypothetical protein
MSADPFGSLCTTPAGVVDEDKPKIAYYAAMMAIQNFGFFLMYYAIFGDIPDIGECGNLRFWIGFFALDCFVESFVCIWMGMGGYTDNSKLFNVMWILHLLVALPYCISTVGIPMAIYSTEGEACMAANAGPLYRLKPTYWTHCVLFLVYVWMMLSITYYSFIKPNKIVDLSSFTETATGVLDADKPKIAFYGVMMAIQNFAFFIMYYAIFGYLPDVGECGNLRFWVAFFALDCFVESFVCLWMNMAGYINNSGLFKVMWILHLLVALPYCVSTVGIPMAIYSTEGEACLAAKNSEGPLYTLKPTYWTHCVLFLVYVWMMLSVTYYSFVRPVFFPSEVSAEKKGLLTKAQP